MWRTYVRKIIHSAAILLTSFGFANTDAAASWTFIVDLDSTDIATNPGYPSNQSSAGVGAYLQDLLNLPDAPNLRGQNDAYDGDALSGIGDPTAPDEFLLAFHFGNGNDYWGHDATFDVFFSCLTGCDAFTLQNTKGISNYRLYSAAADVVDEPCCGPSEQPNRVPEPGSMALLGLGLAGLRFSRREPN